jgi:hypothetical protein
MDAFYKKLYSDLTREEFDKRMATAKSAIDPENLAQLEKAVADIRVPHPWATLGTWASIAFFQIHLARVDRTFQLATDREAIAQIATRGTNRRGRQAIVSLGRTGPFGPGEAIKVIVAGPDSARRRIGGGIQASRGAVSPMSRRW